MHTNDPMENLIKNLRYRSDPEARGRILKRAYGVMDDMENPAPATNRPARWRMTMNTPAGKFALAAAAILIVLGGITLWPVNDSGNGPWWQGPSAAYGQDILDALGRIEAVVYRQRSAWDSAHGVPEMNVGWEKRYNARDCYRRDRYDDGVNVMNTQWVTSDAQGLLMTEVSHEYECFLIQENEAYGFIADFLKEMDFYVGLLDRADRLLEPQVFDGHECVGFEIGAARYGDNPEGRFDRIWYDVETKLPMRIERHGIQTDHNAGRTLTIIHDQFEYFAEVPADLFVPAIPEGYVNAHPDEIRQARDRQVKGDMAQADVPAGLKEAVVTALRAVQTGSYHEGRKITSFSRTSWRKDIFIGDPNKPFEIRWYRPEGEFSDEPFEPQGKRTLTESIAKRGTTELEIVSHTDKSSHAHPIDRISFLVGLIDKADVLFESIQIDGIDCFGFEISAKKYGDNPDGTVHRVYFDAATDLPVRMEFQYVRDDGTLSPIFVKDRFVWDLEFPKGFFTPEPYVKMPTGLN